MNTQRHFFQSIVYLVLILGCKFTFSQTNFWQQSPGLSSGGIPSLSINQSNHIFAGVSPTLILSNSNGYSSLDSIFGIYRSIDNGDNWTQTGFKEMNVMSIAIDSNSHIFTGTDYPTYGIYRSIDNGDTWEKVYSATNIGVMSLAINSYNHIFAGFSERVLRSTDNGNTWTYANSGIIDTGVSTLAINLNDHIFAGTANGVYRSTDNGDSWKQIFTKMDTWVYSIVINSSGHIFVGTANHGIFRSIDSGNTWDYINTGLTNTWVKSLVINAEGHIFAGTYGHGVFRSINNGDSWIQINTGLTNTDIEILAISPNGYIYAGTYGGGVFRSVEPVSYVKEFHKGIPSSFLLEQNYPNPFNSATVITYAIPKKMDVSLIIYNILGQKVKTLVKKELNPGEYKVTWDGTDNGGKPVASGVYLYQLKAGDFVQTKKLILLK